MYFIKLFFVCISVEMAPACSEQASCNSCAGATWWGFNCKWCPLTEQCHYISDFSNPCAGSQSITNDYHCPSSSSAIYSPSTARQMAIWSSLVYVNPEDFDKRGLQRAVQLAIDGHYQVVEFLHVNCDFLLDYDHCYSAIAISHTAQSIVLSFKGTSQTNQIMDELLSAVSGTTNDPVVGGRVWTYFYKTHAKLLPCIKARMTKLTYQFPSYRVYMTGHSLGGALAQLSAAYLVKFGVVQAAKLDVYTFGSPRVGDIRFAYEVDKLLQSNWRVVHYRDKVPHILPEGFLAPALYHAKREIWYPQEGMTINSTYIICKGNEDTRCSDSMANLLDLCWNGRCLTYHYNYFVSIAHYMKDMMVGGRPPVSNISPEQCNRIQF